MGAGVFAAGVTAVDRVLVADELFVKLELVVCWFMRSSI